MNRTYRLVFCRSLGLWRVASETARTRGQSWGRGTVGALTLPLAGVFASLIALSPHAQALVLGGDVSGDLVEDSGGIDITQSERLIVGGETSLNAGTGNITLTDTSNDFLGTVTLNGGDVVIADANGLALGVLDVGALTVSSAGQLGLGSGVIGHNLTANSNGGSITQSGSLDVRGTSMLDAGTGGITLTDAGNVFSGAMSVTGGGIDIEAVSDLEISGLNQPANSALRLVAGGTLALPIQVIDTGTAGLELASRSGGLMTQGTLSGANATLLGQAGVNLGHDVSATAGMLSLISDAGSVSQGGGTIATPVLTVDASGSAVLGSNNQIAALGNVSVEEALTLRNASAIVQSLTSTVSVGGEARFTSAGDIMLANEGNAFGGPVHLTGEDALIATSGGLTLGQVEVTSLELAASDISQAMGSPINVTTDLLLTDGTFTVIDAAAANTTAAADTVLIVGLGGVGTLGGDVAIQSGATLGGSGIIEGDVVLASGATLAPGNSVGTLTVGGDLSLAQGSLLDFEFGVPGASSGALGQGDSVSVNGNLALDGVTLNVSDAGGFGPGVYRLFDYGGTLVTDNDGITLGDRPADTELSIQTLIGDRQINLLNTTGIGDTIDPIGLTLNFWNGNGLAGGGRAGGGDGIWSLSSPVWTDDGGRVTAPMQPMPGFAVFGGTTGRVTVSGRDGAVSVSGMQFVSDGYWVGGDAIGLHGGAESVIRVGNGANIGVGVTATIASQLTGGSRLVKRDLGTLILTGDNAYVGGTTLAGGTLSVSSDANLGHEQGGLRFEGGTLQVTDTHFSATDRDITWGSQGGGFDIAEAGHTFTVGQAINGGGDLLKTGEGILALTGANNYGDTFVEAGILVGHAGAISGDLANAATVIFEQPANDIFAGTITGDGELLFTGGGAVELTGDSGSYAGTATIDGATLTVNNKLGGALIIGSAGRLQGTGAVGATTVGDGGILAPGTSLGELRVHGDLVFDDGSTYEIEVEPSSGDSDHMHVSGIAYLGGSVAHIGLGEEDDYALDSSYRILTAEGGVEGEFAAVSSSFTFLDAALHHDSHSVDLALSRNDIEFAEMAGTDNQRAVASAIASLARGQGVYDAVVTHTGSAAQLRDDYDRLSGELHASVHGALVEDSRLVRDAVNDRLRAITGGATAPMEVDDNSLGNSSADNSTATSSAAWMRAIGNWGRNGSDGNAASLDRDILGVVVGVDAQGGGWGQVGMMVGYTRSDLGTGGGRGDADVDSAHFGLYAATRLGSGDGVGNLLLRGGIFYGYHEVDSQRYVLVGTFRDRLEDERTAHTLHTYGELAYQVNAGVVTLEPFAKFAHVHQHTSSSGESGGDAALYSSSQSSDTSFATLGVRPSVALSAGKAAASVYGSVGWRHAFGDTAPEFDQRFLEGDTFTVAGTPLAEDALIIEAGISLALNERASLDIAYGGQYGDGMEDHGARAAFKWLF